MRFFKYFVQQRQRRLKIMIINLTYKDIEIVLGFDMTFGCGPVTWVKKAGFPKKRRKEIAKITDWFIDNFLSPIHKQNKALMDDESRWTELFAISKDFDLPFRWIQIIYELLDVGLLLARDESVYYDLRIMCYNHELPEMQECYAKFKKVVESVKAK